MRRVVITGVGVVTPLGLGLGETLAAIQAGRSAIGPTTRFDAGGFKQRLAAEVTGLDLHRYFTAPKAIKLTDQAARLGVVAARQARDESGYPGDEQSLEALGVLVGSSGADLQPMELSRALGSDPQDRVSTDIPYFAQRVLGSLNPLWLLINLPNMISTHVATQIGARGPNSTVMTDCIAGLQSIGEAAAWIRDGEADAVLAGGADAGVLPIVYGTYEQAGFFDRSGDEDAGDMIPGEGAAVLMLEEREAAIARGAKIRGDVVAYAAAASPLPSPSLGAGALASTMARALASAGWDAASVQRLVVTSLGTPAHAAAARVAVETVLGADAERIATRPHMPVLGNALGAAGAIEAALLLAAEGPGARLLCSALGASGQAVTLAFGSAQDRGDAST